ncbi:hypothetical protein ACJIZ3_024530 [Penstemon smallii]|uniref:WRKY domain-containing protein n=1 Tax=Penstemon smallii TaxID=265156 RepID=A0ABD3TS39_9LAMI
MEFSSCIATASGTSITTDHSKRLIRELTRGRESADLLRTILRENINGDYDASVLSLVDEILGTFNDSISIITTHCESDEVSDQVPAVMNSSGRKSQDSGGTCKKPASIERRGCHKRRRNSETETKETITLFEDGHAWRKYGQKLILNSKHPRNYYRCTHKFDQKCKATKQVQKIQDDPEPLFRTTYHGYHTCKFKSHDDHQIIVDTAAQDDSSVMWSFNSTPNVSYDGLMINPTIKHEEVYRVKPPPSISGHDYFDPADYFIKSPDELMKPFDGSDHGDDVMSSDVYSCSASTHSIDMQDIMAFQDLLEI